MKLKLIRDPEFERFVPPLNPKEREFLEESILREGCRDAIIVWNGVILDGYNRYAICVKHDLPFQVRNLQLDGRDEAIAWICTNQMGRRNITEETRRYLIGKRYDAEKRIGARNATGRNQHSPQREEVSPTMLGKARNCEYKYGVSGVIGNEYQMSHATVEKYGRYAQAVDRIAAVEPRVVPHILSGSVQIGQDNLIEMGKLSDQQIRAVTAAIPYNTDYHLSRDKIIDALRRDHARQEPAEPSDVPEYQKRSVKTMPDYDPDAEVSSLTLTIPSWRTSMERVRSSANMQNVSASAKDYLRKELASLRSTIEALFSSMQEE